MYVVGLEVVVQGYVVVVVQYVDEIGMGIIVFVVLVVVMEVILDLYYCVFVCGQYQGVFWQCEVDCVVVFFVVMVELFLWCLVYMQVGCIEWQVIGDIFGLCGWVVWY